MLKSIQLAGVGPVPNLSAEFAPRLNVLTGDNGLGKSFLLDIAFRAMTGAWPGGRVAIPEPTVGRGKQLDLLHPLHPPFGKRIVPTIAYEIVGKTGPASMYSARYDFASQTWDRRRWGSASPGLVIYAAVDGTYSVWDPARNQGRRPGPARTTGTTARKGREPDTDHDEQPRAYQFTTATLANGLPEESRTLCNGLIQDWTTWFYQRARDSTLDRFDLLESVVRSLSHPRERMKSGTPRKVFLNDIRQFPTIDLESGGVAYSNVAFPHWPAGMKRVLSLAYLIVWAWTEHLQAAELQRVTPTDRLILIIDEIESHLHPKWQRTILPALIGITEQLRTGVKSQVFCATHSPLILASLEPHFRADEDRLFWFDLQEGVVHFREYPWAIQGDVVGWLTSEIFDLKQRASREAEDAIEAAEAFMRGDVELLPSHLTTREQIQTELERLLPGLDPFWPRWLIGTIP